MTSRSASQSPAPLSPELRDILSPRLSATLGGRLTSLNLNSSSSSTTANNQNSSSSHAASLTTSPPRLASPPHARNAKSADGSSKSTLSSSSSSSTAASVSSTFAPAHQDSSPTYENVDEYVAAMGGKRPIRKVLIANNGIAAVKAIRSIKKWSYDVFGHESKISFVAMATPEDLAANAEYIHLADEFVRVPGGTNNNNYANVMLITEIAERCGADAVWAGWGHASENPRLPESLSRTSKGVIWIGPPASAMRSLGDKIGSTIIAQSSGVPCMPWNGMDLRIDYKREGIPSDVYASATVTSAAEAMRVTDKIGLPVMIKASEGGGGKGIRKVERAEQIEMAYAQVRGEVPGSPIFIMKLAPIARHLEVQLLADEWGDAIAIFGRDCSVQRRHQKIIEEGPVVAAPPTVLHEMEQCAISMAKAVGYVGAGTVEYLYTPDNKYYFLELNPRLQVEHPVSELISGVNLPAAQLQVAMGIPLHRLPGVRRMYGHQPLSGTPIDYARETPRLLPGHVIACRITAENPDAEFQPTSGQIQELNFRSTPAVWGYFSVGAHGNVHEFSDSQFGHLFALGESRDIARRNMVLALKELSIRGDIRTTVGYLAKVLETEDFKDNHIDTTWLERVMALQSVQAEKPKTHLAVLLGAIYRAYAASTASMNEFMLTLERGQMPSRSLYQKLVEFDVSLIYEDTKYMLEVSRSGPHSFDIAHEDLSGSSAPADDGNDDGSDDTVADPANRQVFSADVHTLADGGLLVLMDGKKHVLYGKDYPTGLRLIVDGKTCIFSTEYDPTQLRSNVAGKLVRFVVPDGAHVAKGQAYAEMEVMKMYVTLAAPEAGTLQIVRPEGSILESGDLIARLALDNPSQVKKATVFRGRFPPMGAPHHTGYVPKVNLEFEYSLEKVRMLLQGYTLGPGVAEASLATLMKALRSPRLPLLQFEEIYSALAGRIPERLFEAFQAIAKDYDRAVSGDLFYWESAEPFPVLDIEAAIESALRELKGNEAETATLQAAMAPVHELLDRYRGGNHENAVGVVSSLLEQYYQVESLFSPPGCEPRRPEEVTRELRKTHSNDMSAVLETVLAHHQLARRSHMVLDILRVIERQLRPLLIEFSPVLRKLSALSAKPYAGVVLRARQQLMRLQLPSSDQREIAIRTIFATAQHASSAEERRARLMPLIDQSTSIADMIFSLFQTRFRAESLEVYLRRVYQAYTITDLRITGGDSASVSPAVSSSRKMSASSRADKSKSLLLARWQFQSEGSTRLEEEVSQSPSAGGGVPPIRSNDSFTDLRKLKPTSSTESPSASSTTTTVHRVGVFAYSPSFDALKRNFERALEELRSGDLTLYSEPVHVLYLSCPWTTRRLPTDEQFIQYFGTFIQGRAQELEAAGVRRVTFVVARPDDYPGYFTFRHHNGYLEDALVRHIEPPYALHMELARLSRFDLEFVATSNRMVHLFLASPVPGSYKEALGGRRAPRDGYDGRRFFARVIVRQVDSVLLSTSEQADAAQANGAAAAASPANGFPTSATGEDEDADTFLEEASDSDAEAVSDVGADTDAVLQPVYSGAMDVDAHPEVEFAFVEALNSIEMALADRRATNLHLYRNNHIFINVLIQARLEVNYIEAVIRTLARRYSEKITRLRVSQVEFLVRVGNDALRFICANPTGAALLVDVYSQRYDARSGDYVFVRHASRNNSATGVEAVANSAGTEGLGKWHDLPISTPYSLNEPFEWERHTAHMVGTTYVYDFVSLFAKALRKRWRRHRMQHRGKKAVKMPARLLDAVELVMVDDKLVEMNRSPGNNTIGMVAWRMTLRTPEYPDQGRDIVVIANDITHLAGTFGTAEDWLFARASQFARARGIPRIYISANSGARIGLATEVRDKLRVAWNNDDPSRGLDYLYLAEEDYEPLRDAVQARRVEAGPEVRYVIQDIVGQRHGLGVENLQGSGRIAGETSQAYEEIFTLTYVTARSVGIGAYLARLGHRCIQRHGAPILLTGYKALNKLLGRTVYSSNVQLGGLDIMHANGVTHRTVEDDVEGVREILNWLQYVPVSRQSPPLVPALEVLADPVDRDVAFYPPSEPHDTRCLLTGAPHPETGEWLSGFFDRGSFTEVMDRWAMTVITGRARLGGIPMGVIAVETRTVEDVRPADPAAPESKEQVVLRAGQVWYPDSAFKTAQAIRDMQAEDLPVMVFANWRGFSGGMQDMYDEVLKFGSYIVDSLRDLRQPVFVYIPPNGTLRGGAWVVVDSTINRNFMEMYAADNCRAGVLEPEGTVDVKFRPRDVSAMIRRVDPQMLELQQQLDAAGDDEHAAARISAAMKRREELLKPLYHQVASKFCDLHDTPYRMVAKKAVRAQVDWTQSRRYFYWRLRRRLEETRLVRRVLAAQKKAAADQTDAAELLDEDIQWERARERVLQVIRDAVSESADAEVLDSNQATVEWMQAHAADLEQRIAKVVNEILQHNLVALAQENPDAFTQGVIHSLEALDESQLGAIKKALKFLVKLN